MHVVAEKGVLEFVLQMIIEEKSHTLIKHDVNYAMNQSIFNCVYRCRNI